MTALAAAAFFQEPATMANDVHLMMIAVWIIAGFFLLVTLGLVIAGIVVMTEVGKAKKELTKRTDALTASVMPMVHKANDLFNNLEPRVRSVAADVEHISAMVRSKADEAGESFSQINTTVRTTVGKVGITVDDINTTVKDVNGKTQAQVSRVNGIVSKTLTSTEEITHTVTEAIRRPVVKVAQGVATVMVAVEDIGSKFPGLIAGLVSKFTQPAPTPRPKPVPSRRVPMPVPVPEPVVYRSEAPEPVVVVTRIPENEPESGKM